MALTDRTALVTSATHGASGALPWNQAPPTGRRARRSMDRPASALAPEAGLSAPFDESVTPACDFVSGSPTQLRAVPGCSQAPQIDPVLRLDAPRGDRHVE